MTKNNWAIHKLKKVNKMVKEIQLVISTIFCQKLAAACMLDIIWLILLEPVIKENVEEEKSKQKQNNLAVALQIVPTNLIYQVAVVRAQIEFPWNLFSKLNPIE